MSLEAELVVDCGNAHGEGIIWNPADQKVWWTDISGHKLWSYDPASGESGSVDTPERVCCFAPRKSGGLILALAGGLAFSDDGSSISRFYDFEPNQPETRFNDGRTDRRGRLIVGGMNEVTNTADSSVVRVDLDGSVTTLIEQVAISNSICFSPDGATLYFTDTPSHRILAYPYDQESGTLGEPRVFADLAGQAGSPDGSCVDRDGGLWNAEWGGSRVARHDGSGEIKTEVRLPVSNVTCCAFGGRDLDTLFITTSRIGLDDDALTRQPAAGGLFAIKTGWHGVADLPFLG